MMMVMSERFETEKIKMIKLTIFWCIDCVNGSLSQMS